MKISIVTPVYNDPRIRRCLESVSNQVGDFELEQVVVDSNSTDETVDVLEAYDEQIDVLIRESDDGIYDAMNKGVSRATGDVIGILNADDQYHDPWVLQDVADKITATGADVCYGDLVYVDGRGNVARHWKSGEYEPLKFYLGWMPPHPTFFVRRELYEKHGQFDRSLSIAADYEFMLRLLLKETVSVAYVDRVLVKMAPGGESNESIENMVRAVQEMYMAWRKHGLLGRYVAPFLHPVEKIPQFFREPPKSHIESTSASVHAGIE